MAGLYMAMSLNVNRSIWKSCCQWTEDASERTIRSGHSAVGRDSGRVSDVHGQSGTGVMFHSGDGVRWTWTSWLSESSVRRRSIGLEWYGWHGFRRGIASNLYELGADEKVVQRILRHAKPHVTKERYIKAFDPAVLAAMKKLEASLDAMTQCAAIVHQMN